ncbi:MAG: FkbM family methyltransferase [Proteobacteria bacterium]|nr:FkbM family methyltransferase [Pseudomonadota bacterium]NBP14758.1 FkbM family methyltransferase [bacterium]
MLFLENIKEKFPRLNNIFEVGAHRGNDIDNIIYTWPEANIYAFEADPFNYSIVKNKFENNNKVKVYNLAVTEKTQKLQFNRYYPVDTIPDEKTFEGQNCQNSGQGSIFKPGKGMKEIFKVNNVYETIEVDSVSLFDFCNTNSIQSIDALFMDVQGAEYNVLLGCKDLINSVRATVFEWSKNYIMYEGETSFDDIARFLNKNGLSEAGREYQFFDISGDSLFMRTNNG